MQQSLHLTLILVLDARLARVEHQQAAACRRHEDAGEVLGVVEPGAVHVVLWTGRSAAVQLHSTCRRTYVRTFHNEHTRDTPSTISNLV